MDQNSHLGRFGGFFYTEAKGSKREYNRGMEVKSLHAREILDSRGLPTLEVTIETTSVRAVASVPSGRSVGSREAHELRDNDARYGGMGVRRAVGHVENDIAGAIVRKSFDQHSFDEMLVTLDGTPQKSRLGANALLGVSLAFARACARESGAPLWRHVSVLAGSTPALPQPCFNVINGGAHADSGLAIQEFMLVPTVGTIADKIETAAVVIEKLRELLTQRNMAISVGDEGGFAPKLGSDEAALDLLVEAIGKTGKEDVSLAIDAAANHFYKNSTYILGEHQKFSADELSNWYENLVFRYPLISIEDPFAEEDWDAFAKITATLGEKIRIVGDDLLVTNPARIKEAVEKRAVNTALIKPNQIGTLSEAIDASTAARQDGMALFASHRSGETNDDFISDFAVGLGCEFFKAGSLARGERVAKYNRLMEIEQELHA